MKQTLTLSGGVITDAERNAALYWTPSQSGGGVDDSGFVAPRQAINHPGGLFIGRAATNLFRWGQCDAATDWSATTTGAINSTDATVPAPFSPQSIKCVCDGTQPNQGPVPITATGQAAVAGTVGVGSIYFLGVAGQSYKAHLRWDNTDASTTDGAQTTFVATGAWQLITPASVAVAVGKTGDRLRVRIFINGTRAETVWAAHPMLEKDQSAVAPYVATSGGATATYPAGRIQVPSTLLNATQGWVAMRIRVGLDSTVIPSNTNKRAFQFQDDGTHRIIGYYADTIQKWVIQRDNVTGGSTASQAGGAFAKGDFVTVVFAWTATQTKVSVNGGAFVAVANSLIPTFAAPTFDIGTNLGTAQWIDSDVLWFACGTGTMTSNEASDIHSALTTNITAHGALTPSMQTTCEFPHAGFGAVVDPVVVT